MLAAAAIQAVGIDPAIGKALAAVLNDPEALDLALTTIAVTFLSQGGGLSIDDVAKKFLLQNGVTMRRGRRQEADSFELQLQYKTTVDLAAVQASANAYNDAVAAGGVMFTVVINGQTLEAQGVAAKVPTADDVMMVCVQNCNNPTAAPTAAPTTPSALKELKLTIDVAYTTLNATDIYKLEADVKAEIQRMARDATDKIQSVTFTAGSSRRARRASTTIATVTFKESFSDTDLDILVTAIQVLVASGSLTFTIGGVTVSVTAVVGSKPPGTNTIPPALLAAADGAKSSAWLMALATAAMLATAA